MTCRTSHRTAKKMHMYNLHVELVGVRLKKYAYVCHVAQVETTLQHCLADVCGVESGCVGGGGGGSVVSTLTGSPHNLMHTILKMPSVVIARTMDGTVGL